MRSRSIALRTTRSRNRTRDQQTLGDVSPSRVGRRGHVERKPVPTPKKPATAWTKAADAAVADEASPRCRCGEAVVVCILEGYAAGRPSYRRLCASCDRAWTAQARRAQEGKPGVWRRSFGSLGIALGAVLSLVAVGAEQVVVQSHAGFGMWQQLGVLAGLAAILLGLTLRLDFVSVAGVLTLGLAAVIDFLGPIVGAESAGARQAAAMFGALLLMTVGLLLYRGARAPSNGAAAAVLQT